MKLTAEEREALKQELKREIFAEISLAEEKITDTVKPWAKVKKHLYNRAAEIEKPCTRAFWDVIESTRWLVKAGLQIRRVDALLASQQDRAIALVDAAIDALKEARKSQ